MSHGNIYTNNGYVALTESDKEDVRRMLSQNYTYKQIAEFIGCNITAISYWAQKFEMKRYRKINTVDRKEAAKEVNRLLSGVAKKYGTSVRNLCTIMLKTKIDRGDATD